MFDWTFTAVTGTDQAVEINSRGTGIGTIRRADGAISGFNGVVYSKWTMFEARVNERRRSAGRSWRVSVQPPNGTGAISLILDPSGHPLGIYSRAFMPMRTP